MDITTKALYASARGHITDVSKVEADGLDGYMNICQCDCYNVVYLIIEEIWVCEQCKLYVCGKD